MAKILVSIISYKERDLRGTVLDCYNKAVNKDDLYFSIVEEHFNGGHCDLSEIPANQIRYEKYDLSEFRGILWARNRTVEIDVEYDYILYICGHTRFAYEWDKYTFQEYAKAVEASDTGKAVLTFCPADYQYNDDWTTRTEHPTIVTTKNYFHPNITNATFPQEPTEVYDFVPGAWFPHGFHPEEGKVSQGYWIHFTWCFADKNFVKEVPLDPEINFNCEEPYISVQSWCRGWRSYATPYLLGYHHRDKKYPGFDKLIFDEDRPWVDRNKEKYWQQSDASMIKLNLLLSGRLEGKYGNITHEQVLDFCKASGMNPRFTKYDPNYHLIKEGYQNFANRRHEPPLDR
jgi:hypothetical protein